jgi:hypothetical protein
MRATPLAGRAFTIANPDLAVILLLNVDIVVADDLRPARDLAVQ